MPPNPDEDKESEEQRFNRIFSSLPTLGSRQYIEYVKNADAASLSPPVLARAYRQLPPDSEAAKATIGRLLDFEDRHGYLAPLQRAARRRISRHDWFDSDELVLETIKEIYLSIGTTRGAGAEVFWFKFLRQRLEDAYRSLNGRHNERRDPERAAPRLDEETRDEIDPLDEVDSSTVAAWHGEHRSGSHSMARGIRRSRTRQDPRRPHSGGRSRLLQRRAEHAAGVGGALWR